VTAYDIIGDVHGSADKLLGLLDLLGYRVRDGVHHHPERTAVFVGDLIDRGPDQVEVVRTVRAMHEAGSALVVLGNHEFNALAWSTPDPAAPGEFARTHGGPGGPGHSRQHRAYLDQVVEGSDLHRSHLAWFATLPRWLDLDGLRVAHACWHQPSLDVLDAWAPPGTPLDDRFVLEASRKGSVLHQAVEVVLKGPEVRLPDGCAWRDPEGTLRRTARLRWWDDLAPTAAERLAIPDNATTPDGDPYPGVPDDVTADLDTYAYRDDVPVFFGHYWFTRAPAPASPRAVCVDYSAVRPGHPLVAYRWDGGPGVSADRFVGFPGTGSAPVS